MTNDTGSVRTKFIESLLKFCRDLDSELCEAELVDPRRVADCCEEDVALEGRHGALEPGLKEIRRWRATLSFDFFGSTFDCNSVKIQGNFMKFARNIFVYSNNSPCMRNAARGGIRELISGIWSWYYRIWY